MTPIDSKKFTDTSEKVTDSIFDLKNPISIGEGGILLRSGGIFLHDYRTSRFILPEFLLILKLNLKTRMFVLYSMNKRKGSYV